ncbi:hypothetical protein U1Q18_005517, partial [Sarracenia purpurea var. burkii]
MHRNLLQIPFETQSLFGDFNAVGDLQPPAKKNAGDGGEEERRPCSLSLTSRSSPDTAPVDDASVGSFFSAHCLRFTVLLLQSLLAYALNESNATCGYGNPVSFRFKTSAGRHTGSIPLRRKRTTSDRRNRLRLLWITVPVIKDASPMCAESTDPNGKTQKLLDDLALSIAPKKLVRSCSKLCPIWISKKPNSSGENHL